MTKENAITYLRNAYKPGGRVVTDLAHVSRSGMNRSIKVILCEDGLPVDVSAWVAAACGLPFDRKNGGVKVGGCGMDMGFAVAYELSAVLFPNGFQCIAGPCPSNDHSNGDRDYSPHHHKDGGYALRHRWL